MEAAALNVAWHERRKQREAAWAQVPEQERGDRGLSNDNLAERQRTLVQDFWDTQHALGLEQDQDVDQGFE